ncbi:MAG: penicillin-binding protein 2 [Alphaproteobacteria bacterium]|nr:penicillin-binding protein 2 [Alphaproteobacteria bacterium]
MRPHELQKLVSRRAVIFGGVQAAAGMALLSRLYFLQFVHGDEFKLQSEDNRAKLQLIIPPRGIISDRYGVAMAMNQVNYRLVIEPDSRTQARATLKVLAPLMRLREGEVRQLTDAIRHSKVGIPILVREHLSWEEVARIQYHLPELGAASIEEGQWRHYPFADHASHLIGYVGKVAPEEVDKSQPLLSQPDMKIGKNGIESVYEARLQGKAGSKQIEVNAAGSPVRELSRQAPSAGEALPLTIDSRLQEFAIERLGEESGAIVVMDVNTGEVLALVSMPAFDPNEFSKGIKSGYYGDLRANKRAPLLNKAIAGQYPPGSTFKMMTGLAGLKSGKFNAHSHVHCNGTFYLGNHPFTCWKVEGHGTLTMAEAIEQSCDVFFYTVAREIGIEALAAMAREFGLGQKSGLGLRGEQPGIVPSPAWKQKVGRGAWNPGETINSAIGQGDTLTTPIQLAMMTARLVNGGKKILPRLLLDEANKFVGDVEVSPAHLDLIREGMFKVVNDPRGTAHGSAIKDERYAFGGKTGTSQVRKLLVHGQNQNLIPWEFRHHALFVGYAPVDKPEICCSVIIEHGGGGASAAAPVARDVLQKAMELRENPPLNLDKTVEG